MWTFAKLKEIVKFTNYTLMFIRAHPRQDVYKNMYEHDKLHVYSAVSAERIDAFLHDRRGDLYIMKGSAVGEPKDQLMDGLDDPLWSRDFSVERDGSLHPLTNTAVNLMQYVGVFQNMQQYLEHDDFAEMIETMVTSSEPIIIHVEMDDGTTHKYRIRRNMMASLNVDKYLESNGYISCEGKTWRF